MSRIDRPNGYRIESGIPLPGNRIGWKKYSFDEMDVGQSFALETSDIKEIEAVRAAASYYGIRHRPKKFAVRMADPATRTYRCWRVA